MREQATFAFMIAVLIIYANIIGFKVTFGDAWAKEGEGRPHSKNSFHYKRLALDLNLFKNDKYLPNTEDHAPLGSFWKHLGGTWGGDFTNPDGNHYSWGEKK